jgi:hypothetical protein
MQRHHFYGRGSYDIYQSNEVRTQCTDTTARFTVPLLWLLETQQIGCEVSLTSNIFIEYRNRVVLNIYKSD